MIRRFVRTFWIALVAVAQAPSAAAQDGVYPLPLEVLVGRTRLTDTLLALQRGTEVFLPVDALAAEFEFPVEIDAAEAYAEGWFLAEDRTFSIDAQAHEAISEGRRIELDAHDFITDELETTGELYVSRAALNAIWPVEMEIDMARLALQVTPEEPLPAKRRQERAKRRERLLARNGDNRNLVPVSDPYRLWSAPAFDFTSQIDLDQGRFTGRQQVNWAHDLLGVSSTGLATVRVQGSDPELGSLRLTLRRADIVADLPLGIEDIQAGDVSRQPQNRIGGLSRGRGIVLSAFPINRADEFDTTTIEGDAPIGYEAELYRNGRLLEFQEVDSEGRYTFTDVPLIFGFNRFRVVLYGPQGQVRERVETIDASGALAKPGETLVRVSAIETGRDLIPLGEETRREDEVGLSLNGLVAQGINQEMSAFGAVSTLPTREGDKEYVVGGLNAALLAGNAQLRALGSTDGGFGVDFRSLQRVGGLRFTFNAGYFRDFESPEVGFGESATALDARLRTNTNVDLGFGNLGLTFDTTFERQRSGLQGLDLQATQRLRSGRYGLTHTLNQSIGDLQDSPTRGQLDINFRLRPFTLRGGAQYDSDVGARQFRGDLRYRGGRHVSAGANLSFNVPEDRATVGLDLTRPLGPILGSLTAGWEQGEGFRIGLRLNVAFGPGAHGDYAFSRRNRTNGGSLRARVYLDSNANGVHDPEEPPIEGARLGGDVPSGAPRTDADGLVQVDGLRPLEPRAVSLRERSLANPFWLPAAEGYRVIPKPGTVTEIDIPVTATGSIDGAVRLRDSDAGLPGVTVRLLDETGNVVKTTTSYFDGFFAFDQIRYGTYYLDIGQRDRFSEVVPPDKIELGHDTPFASQQDILLER